MVDIVQGLCNRAQVDWEDLRYVLALAKHGTFSQAAAALGTTHTTVSRRLRGLEESLGTPLFDATPDGFVLTAAGEQAVHAAERVEQEVLTLQARVFGGDARLSGKLRVTTMDILYRRYRVAFTRFAERYPGIELTVSCNDVEASLTRRDADVALRMTNTPPEHLVGRKLGHVEFAVYAAKSLVTRVGRGQPYAAYPWLHWDERLGASWLDAWLSRNAPEARIAARVDAGSLALREIVASGMGVHFLAVFEGDEDGRLERIGPVDATFNRDIWLLTLADLKQSSRVRAFLDHMHEVTSPNGLR